jgi:hypothetical protein
MSSWVKVGSEWKLATNMERRQTVPTSHYFNGGSAAMSCRVGAAYPVAAWVLLQLVKAELLEEPHA